MSRDLDQFEFWSEAVFADKLGIQPEPPARP